MNTLGTFFKKTHIVLVGVSFAALMIVGGLAFQHNASAQTSTGNVTGDIWSSTIGRISLNCQNGGATGGNVCSSSAYSVNVTQNTSTQTGSFSGYAWSSYIGWVSFNPSDASACGTAASLNFATGAVTGWIRALSGSNASGWDGCISLSGTGYGVSYNAASSTNNLTGFAWGDVNVGWVGFTSATLTLATVTSTVDLKANGNDTLSLPPYGGSVVLSWVGTNLASTACTASGNWSGSKTPSSGGSSPAVTIPANTTTAPVTYTYTISCTGANSSTVTDTATVVVASTGIGGSAPYLSFEANGVKAGALSSPGKVNVFAGDTVNFKWDTTNIQPNSCVGQITGTTDSSWTTGFRDSADTPPVHTYNLYNISGAPTDRTYIMHGCLDFTNTALPDQAITIHILPPASCRVVSSTKTASAVITVPSGGITNATKNFGVIWDNVVGFFPVTLSVPSSSLSGPTVSITNPLIATKSSFATIKVTSGAITAPTVVPIMISGTPGSTAPATSCTPGTIYLVAPGTCKDPCAIPATIGSPTCGYNTQYPRGCATTKAPWQEF